MRRLLALFLLLACPAFGQQIIKTTAPDNSGVAWSSVTCAATSTPLAVYGKYYLTIQVPLGASQNVCFAWGASATATTSPPSQCYEAGANISWGGGTGACIVGSSTQAISVGVQ
jgi:hypothetical protein